MPRNTIVVAGRNYLDHRRLDHMGRLDYMGRGSSFCWIDSVLVGRRTRNSTQHGTRRVAHRGFRYDCGWGPFVAHGRGPIG